MSVTRRVVVALALLLLVAGAWLAPLDQPAADQVDAGLKRALISFATARALNGIISVAQGTEISVQPAGVGAVLAPGQLLDPVNDLVEQFSNLMLVASVAFGTQKLLIGIGAFWPVSLALTLIALAWGWQHLIRGGQSPWLTRLLVVLLMLRFAVPVVSLGTDIVWQRFLADDYRGSQQAIDATTSDVAGREPIASAQQADQGVLDRLRAWIVRSTDVKARFAELKQLLERATEHIIRLMVVFVLQTLVVPLLLLWLMWSAARALFASAGGGGRS